MGTEVQHVRSHVLRPLFVVIGIVIVLLVVRQLYVPHDFGIQGRGYTYSWYRAGNVQDWKEFTVKFRGTPYCKTCHHAEFAMLSGTPHALIPCEDCHGPARNHPTDPAKLPLDRTRGLCLRCHAKLQYPTSVRGELRGVDPATHNPGVECVVCHMAHHPTLAFLQSMAPRRLPQGTHYCKTCHQAESDLLVGMPHAVIQCVDCHGPAGDHPTDPAKLVIDKTRGLCLRCHANKVRHNSGLACVTCHDPHRSSLQFVQFLP
jgi:predicted CXXCH cytochrome family protein